MTIFEAIHHNQIGPLTGRHQTTVEEAESACCGNACRTIDGDRRDSTGNRRADEIIQMPLIGDIKWVPVIRAQCQKLRMTLGDDGHQSLQVLGDGPLSHQHIHALAHFLQRFFGARRLMLGANACRNVTVEIKTAQKRSMTVDMPALERLQLCHAFRVLGENAGKIHELGETDHLRVPGKGQQVIDQKFSARRFHMRRRYTTRELHADIHDGFHSAIEEEFYPFDTQNICNLVRIADDCRNTLRQYATVEFMRCHMRGFDVKMRIDESRHNYPPGNIDFPLPR